MLVLLSSRSRKHEEQQVSGVHWYCTLTILGIVFLQKRRGRAFAEPDYNAWGAIGSSAAIHARCICKARVGGGGG